jgi:hypothetical protein
MQKESIYDRMTNAEKEVAITLKNWVFNGRMNNPCLCGMKINDQEYGHLIFI